jgi:hypothetical protein
MQLLYRIVKIVNLLKNGKQKTPCGISARGFLLFYKFLFLIFIKLNPTI